MASRIARSAPERRGRAGQAVEGPPVFGCSRLDGGQQLLGAFDAVLHADAVMQALGLAQMDERAAQDDGAVLDRHVLGGAQLLDADGLEQLGADLIVDVEAAGQGLGGVEHGLVEPLARVLRPCGGIGDFLDDDRGHVALVAAGHLHPVAQQEGHEVERLAIGATSISQTMQVGTTSAAVPLPTPASAATTPSTQALYSGSIVRLASILRSIERISFRRRKSWVRRSAICAAARSAGVRTEAGRMEAPAAGAGWPVAAGAPRAKEQALR
jgi:hypothetical protein